MTDLSTNEPSDASIWPAWKGDDKRRCVAHKKNGEQCRRHARRGTSVCDFHGAKAPQVRRKARQRIEEAADKLAKRLIGIALDENKSEGAQIAAIRDLLDRAGVSAKTAVEVDVKVRPWEQMAGNIAGMTTTTRSDSRARRRTPDVAPALVSGAGGFDPDDVVDAEVVDEPEPTETPPGRPTGMRSHDARGKGPGQELMTLEHAQELAAEANRRAGVYDKRNRR